MPKNLGKLLALRDWVSLDEAAIHFSYLLEAEISKAEILRWGIDHRMSLSLYFVNAIWVKPGEFINLFEHPDLTVPGVIVQESPGSDFEVFTPSGNRQELIGMATLMMTRAACSNLRRLQSELAGGPRVSLDWDEAGLMIRLPSSRPQDDGKTPAVILDEHADYGFVPAQIFSNDWQVVVSTAEIRRLERDILSETQHDLEPQPAPVAVEKPLQTRERNSLLTVIAALCHYSDLDMHGKNTVSQISGMTDEIGASLSDDTVRNIIKQTRDLMGTLKK